ncbi:MAG: DUF2147 domain-containing protein [Alistipes sp.]|nr:DUF2147 domain-containing protein [Alistipes sp.]
MKNLLMLAVAGLFTLSSTIAGAATKDGDRILGEYKAVKDGRQTTVRISKIGENRYKAQVVGVHDKNHSDVAVGTDINNPDPTKRDIPSNQIVLIESVSYNGEKDVWDDGQIYDPTKGDVYRVVLDFKNDKTLRVRGYLGPFSRSLYWEKIN